MNASENPRFCPDCGMQAGWHKLKCPHFAPRDQDEYMASLFMAMLEAEEEERRKLSEDGTRDDLEKAFKARLPDGWMGWDGIDWRNGDGFAWSGHFNYRGNRFCFRFARPHGSRERDIAINDAVGDAVGALKRLPCRHERKRRECRCDPIPDFAEWVAATASLAARVVTVCEDCGAEVGS